ncbi:MAG: site-specific integrase [Thermoplasmatales archaeon]|nr:MAG: site-specific integrase [Thermoplasmatales archaeon]
MLKYFEIIDAEPSTYFELNRSYDEDILMFAESIKSWAPVTMKSSVSCIKTFLMYNNVEINPRTKYDLRELCKGPRAISQEWIPTRADLKKILSYGNVKHKALFLTIASSGMRPGEAVRITLGDIYLDETPARIEIPYDITKTKEVRTTFISSEAKSYVNQWLKVRKDYLKSAKSRSTLYPKLEDDNRVFPFLGTALREMWHLVTNKAGYDALDERNGKNKKRHKMTPHKLRKFFRTSLSDAGIPFDIMEALMGHKQGVEAVYRRYSPNQLKQWYLKGEPNLLVFEKPANQEDIDDMKNQLETLTKQMSSIIEFQKRITTAKLEDEEGIPIITCTLFSPGSLVIILQYFPINLSMVLSAMLKQ